MQENSLFFSGTTTRSMKANRILPFFLLFSSFLLLGFWVGRASFDLPMAKQARDFLFGLKASHSIQPTPALGNGQRNILVIGVDDLNTSKPRLESLWLVLYIVDLPQVALLPIYPMGHVQAGAGQAGIYDRLFQLDAEGKPGPAFLEALQAKGLWWSGYILLDEVAMAEVIETARKLSPNDPGSTSGVRRIAEVPLAWEDPTGSLSGQIELAKSLCRHAQVASSRGDITPLLELIPRHARTDLNLTRGAAELESLLANPAGLGCEFPTVGGRSQEVP